ncbi:hypothetical protein [Candidatus Phytoplasma fraxini]|uniref:Uncharacterized protein n=1 Tax=Ash yellows phytoplasma TaxID=35780 RepID=A0ABZ2U8P5_ASHYP
MINKINLKVFILFFIFILLIFKFFPNNLIAESLSSNILNIETVIPEDKRIINISKVYANDKDKILDEIKKINPLLKDLKREYLNIQNNNTIMLRIPENKNEDLKLSGQVFLNLQINKNIEIIIPEDKRIIDISEVDVNDKDKILEEIKKINPLLKDLTVDELSFSDDNNPKEVSIIISEHKKEKLNLSGVTRLKLNIIPNNSINKTIKPSSNRSNVIFGIFILSIFIICGVIIYFYIKRTKENTLI